MKNLTKYLTSEQKKEILKLHNKGLGISTISLAVDEPQLVVQEMLEQQGHDIRAKQYVYNVHGHLQFTGFKSIYVHQWIMAKHLEVDLTDIRKYIVHHVNSIKTDNRELNLWLFWDINHHSFYHAMLDSKQIGTSIDDLYDFCLGQVDRDLKDLEMEEIESLRTYEECNIIREEYSKYLGLIKKLYKKNKKALKC